MWRSIWPDTPADQLPVRFITNGVHLPTWMSARLFDLLTRYLGEGWVERMDDASFGDGAAGHPGCGAVGLARAAAARPVRVRPRADPGALGATSGSAPNRVVAAGAMLDPHVLTSATRGGSPPTSGRS